MSASDDMVVHHITQTPGLILAVGAVLPVHKGGEHTGIAHLTADHSCFDLTAFQILSHLFNKKLLDLINEACSLIVEDVFVIELLYLLVLGIAAAGIRGTEHLDCAAWCVLGRDEVNALPLPPLMVILCAL